MKWIEKDRNEHTITSLSTTGTEVRQFGGRPDATQTTVNQLITAHNTDYTTLATKVNVLIELIEDLLALQNNDDTRVE